jgi:ribosomal protein L11 methyltransferase
MKSQGPFGAEKGEMGTRGMGVPMTEWREVRVTIPKEAQEALANFLMERGSSGIVFEDAEEKAGFEIVKAYFSHPHMIEAQAISRYLEAIREFFPEISPADIRIRRIPDEDWMRGWRVFFKACRAGSRIVVKPPWITLRSRGMIVIDIDPGMAFGTGTHPTTRLCLRALEKAFADASYVPRAVLDVGIGSGILSIAAAKLGARRVVGIDVDQRAIDNARRNIRMNRMGRRIRVKKATISHIGEQFNVAVANIDASSIEEMRYQLVDRVLPGGTLLLSGLLDGEVDFARRLFSNGPFAPVAVSIEGGWACVVLKKA